MKKKVVVVDESVIPVGTKVIVTRHNADKYVTVTRTAIKQYDGGPVVWVKGLGMCYPLDQIEVIKPDDIDKYPMSW